MSRRHDSEAPRKFARITSVNSRGKGFIFATDPQNNEVFIHCQACRPRALFDELITGDGVSFSVSEAPKGLRGHDVRRMTPTEEHEYVEQEQAHKTSVRERRGNSVQHGRRQSFVEDVEHDDRAPRRR